MSWQQPGHRVHRTLLDPPDDGIALSRSQTGWLGRRLRRLVDRMAKGASDRVRRGRNYALRGRARDLLVTTGSATVDVWCDEVYRPTLRLAPLSAAAWKVVTEELTHDLSALAQLLEGELPESLVLRLEDRGVALVPSQEELSGDCDCGDWASPCTHVATLLHLLAEALDGDPFLLLALRGRDPHDLMASLRERWGDDRPLEAVRYASEEAVPDGDPYASPGGLPILRSSGMSDVGGSPGLRALGPAPGEADLMATLGPLYEAGQEAARRVLESVPDREPPRRRPRAVVVEMRSPASTPAEAPAAAAPVEAQVPPPEPRPRQQAGLAPSGPVPATAGDALAIRAVAALAEQDGASSYDLARALGCTVSEVRRALLHLAGFGLVFTRQEEDGVLRWWLG